MDYSFISQNTDNTKYGVETKSNGDIIDMYLDFNTKILSYIINNVNYGKAFIINTELEYTMAVNISGPGTALEIVQYEIQYN